MPPDDKDNQGKSPEVVIGSLDATKAYEGLAEREKLAAQQKAEAVEAQKKALAAKAKTTDTSAAARADLIPATGPAAPTDAKAGDKPADKPAAAPSAAPDHSPEKEERRYQDSIGKLGSSSICPDLVAIIKKKAGAKVDQSAPDAQFATLVGSVMQNMESLDGDIFKKSQTDKSGNFKAFRAVMEKWIGQEAAIAAADKAPRLQEVATNFRNMMDIIEKSEPSAPSAAPAQPASAPGSAPASQPGAQPAAPAETKPEGFFGEIWDKIKGFFSQFTDWIGNLFKPKDSAPTTPPAAPTPAPAAGTSPSPVPAPSNKPISQVESNRASWKSIIDSESKRLKIDPAFAMAIISVEAGKSGLNSDGSPLIRFEAHVFNAQLAKRGIKEKHGAWGSSILVGRNVDGVSCEGQGQASENACFQKALQINKDAAYNSISMGLGQIMGFNSGIVGYSNAENMYNQFSASSGGEPEQVRAMFKLIEKVPAQLNAARNKDFASFARSYNGEGRVAQYSASLQNAYKSNGGGTSGGATAVA